MFKESVKKFALEKYAGDETMANAFVEGFAKQAALMFNNADELAEARFKEELSRNSPQGMFTSGVAGALGKGVGALAAGLGVHGLNMAVSSIQKSSLHTTFLASLAKAISTNRILRDADKEKVEQYAETIFKFAPNVACDSNLLSSILANAVHGEGIDPMTIKTLGDLEGRFVDNRGSGAFSPKTYV
jgi:hypothetical protein